MHREVSGQFGNMSEPSRWGVVDTPAVLFWILIFAKVF
jgi:hypothetical protein